MPDELVCPIHGPYDAALGVCPYCSGESRTPPAPTPLEDDLPTDLGAGPGPGVPEDDLPTDLGYGQTPSPGRQEEDDLTDISQRRQSRGRILDYDEEEETQLARARRDDVTELEYVETGALGILWVIEGNRRGQIYHIKDGTVVGRNEGSLILDDPKVSNPHAKFRVEDDQLTLWDFGSSNGTFVNDERIREATQLNENDKIKMGSMVFVLKILPEP